MTEPPTTVPVCYRHSSRETWVRCSRCERPICPDCMRDASVGHHCPECVAEGRRTQRPARTAFGGSGAGREGYVTKTLIGINALVALLTVVAGGGRALAGGAWGGLLGGTTVLHRDYGMLGYASYTLFGPAHGVAAGEYYRLITSVFLHYGVLHLALNMYALWILGRDLEAQLGPGRFSALYLISGLGGSVAVYLFSAPNSGAAGASGAVFGLFAAMFVVLKRLRRDTSAVVPILVINLVFTFTVSGISWQAHLGGLITGAAVGAVMAYAPQKNRTAIQAVGCVAIGAVLVLLTIARTASILA